jgi:hypothetical protein
VRRVAVILLPLVIAAYSPAASRPPLRHLPPAGLAVETSRGILLVGLDGKAFRLLRGYRFARPPVPLGLLDARPPFLLDSAGRRFMLDARARQAVPVRPGRLPLTRGWTLVRNGAHSGWSVRRGEHTLGPSRGWSVEFVSADRTLVTVSRGGRFRAIDTRAEKLRPLRRGCRVADRAGSRWYLLCRDDSAVRGPPPSTVEVLDVGGSRVVARVPRRAFIGDYWKAAFLSPDRSKLLLTLAAECETYYAFVVPVRGGRILSVLGRGSWPPPQNSFAMGWAPNGDVVVALPRDEGCDAGRVPAGVYRVDARRRLRLAYRSVAAAFWIAR